MKYISIITLLFSIYGCSFQQVSSEASYSTVQRHTSVKSYIPKTGCISGNCENGYGTYLYPTGGRDTGTWQNGGRYGEFTYVNSLGNSSTRYYDNNKNITDQVNDCKKANALSEGYGKFVGGVNIALNLLSGGKVGGSYDWGKNAARKQTVPKAIAIYCY